MRRILFICLAAVLASAVFAGDPPPGSFRVAGISISTKGSVPVDVEHVKSLIFAKKGETATRDTVSADIRNLINSRRYSYVGVNVRNSAEGSFLTFLVEGRHILSEEPTVEGVKHFRKSTAVKKLELKAGDYISDDVLALAADKLRRAYAEDGYRDTVVTGRVATETTIPPYAKAVFSVVENKKTKVGLIRFDGNKVISDSNLRKFSGQRPWWDPTGWFGKKRTGDFELEMLRSDARRQYLDKGYLDVKISEPEKKLTGRRLEVNFNVSEGTCYSIGDVSIVGVTLFDTDELLRGMPLKPGQTAGLTRLETARDWLLDYFISRGYIDTSVSSVFVPNIEEPGVVDVEFSVKEGPAVRIHDIVIRGNTSTKDKVVRREILLNPGDIFDETSAIRSERRLNNLGFFSEVRHFSGNTGDSAFRDLIYELKEQETGSLLVGFGFSSIDHLIGFFEISQSNFDIMNFKNFRGGGQKARLNLQIGSKSTDLETSFIEPWFLDRRLSLSVDGYIRNREYNEYDVRKGGAQIGMSKHVPWVGRMGISYNIEHVTLKDVIDGEFYLFDAPDKTYRYTDEDDSYMLGSLKLSWTYDTRDNPTVPTTGARAVAWAKLYNSVLGSDYDMYELELSWRKYFTIFDKHVLAFYVNGSVIDSFGGDEVPVGNRYYLGGGRHVRGFKYREIGPKVIPAGEEPSENNHRPYGGRTMIRATAEYTIPLGRFIRLAAFCDAGSVGKDSYDFDKLVTSAGVGIRLDFPGFPVRLDYAHALNKDDDLTRDDAFVFWIGFDN